MLTPAKYNLVDSSLVTVTLEAVVQVVALPRNEAAALEASTIYLAFVSSYKPHLSPLVFIPNHIVLVPLVALYLAPAFSIVISPVALPPAAGRAPISAKDQE